MAEKKYRPGSAVEYDLFKGDWCRSCAADSVINGMKQQGSCRDDERCLIVADSMIYNINDPGYPTEWIIDEGGSRCIAFVPVTESIFRKWFKPAGV